MLALEAAEKRGVLTVDLGLGLADQRGTRQRDEVLAGGRRAFVASERFAQEALRAVARHRATESPAGGQAETVVAEIVVARHQGQQGAVHPEAPAQDAPVVDAPQQPLARAQPGVPGRRLGQAPILARPFWRRRFSTRRPPFVLIRTRNPWVRFRFRLFGWKVRFMLQASAPKAGDATRRGSFGAKG
jgi:hypothetical protein